ncbi:uncharacterized protein LOC110105010 [Dendrobium catenatum]|uniref:uncharacterized protein LOC110105010 n=1 Tax=Dendrobium catenatum TaxID=906689 RepID=UPI0009F1C6F7|nr:uncharacterized protein LOC110105010 [Dendrobium catenatum]
MEKTQSSPRNRLKFLCSYGGRILPRPSDGHLRYVGGDTRVLSVPRFISFKELKEKIAGMFNADLVVKYQLMAEDLDTLVSVKTDEDLYHMIDEYDRPRSPTVASSPLFRLFLFPSPAAVATAAAAEPAATLDQRYVDAINGGLPTPQPAHYAGCGGMHRVRSTPNLGRVSGGGSPMAYQRPNAAFGYGGGPGWRMGGGGGFRQEVGCGCGCNCGCVCSSSQLMRKYVPSPPTAGGSPWGHLTEVSPPRRGSQGSQLGPAIAGSSMRVVWE